MKNQPNVEKNSANSPNLKVNFWVNWTTNLKALFTLPKWFKIFLGVLSVVAVVGVIGSFALMSWADDKIETANLTFNGIDRGNKEVKANENAYSARVHFKRLDVLLRSKVIAYIDIKSISWVSQLDSNAVREIKSQNRYIKFISTQNLQALNTQNLGEVKYKMDFSPLLKVVVKYWVGIFLLVLFLKPLYIVLNYIKEKAQISHIQIISSRLGVSFLVFIVTLFVLATFGFLVHIGIKVIYFYLALMISLFVLLYRNPYKIVSLIFYALSFSVAFVLAIYYYDASWDGRAYHQLAIFYLANDYNPIYQELTDVKALSQFLSHEIWIEHYMKFAEITQACIYKVIGQIESGKMINYLFAFGAFFYSIYVLSQFKNINTNMIFLLSFLSVFSPIVFVQISTYYIDGLLACALVFVFLVILDLELTKSKTKFAILIMALLATASIKLTGLGYAGFIGIVYFLYKLIFFGWQKSKGIFISGAISTLLIIICNANPLITNQLQHGHFGYPLMGKDKIDIITSNQPKDFNDLNRFEKLGKSLFSKTHNISQYSVANTELKIPFTKVSGEEYLSVTDTRVAGFGWFYSGILILCFIMLLFNLDKFKTKEFIFAITLVLGSCLINPECWWARYVPQMWLVPFVFIIFSYSLMLNKLSRFLRIVIIAFLLLNLVSISNILNRHFTNSIKAQLTNLHFNYDKALLFFPLNMEKSFGVKLLERGYPIQIISKDELKKFQTQGIEFYPMDNVLDNYDNNISLWNVKPKGQPQ